MTTRGQDVRDTCTYAYSSVRVSDMIRGAINKGTGADASPEYRVSESSSESADSTGAGSRARRCGARGPTPFVPAAVSAAVDTCTRVVGCRCGVSFCLQRYTVLPCDPALLRVRTARGFTIREVESTQTIVDTFRVLYAV